YFLNYEEGISNDFVLTEGGRKRELLTSDIDDWRITFVETGLSSNIGQRLLRVKAHVQNEDVFLANYSDGLSDVPLPEQIDTFMKSGAIGCFLAMKPHLSYHFVSFDSNGRLEGFRDIIQSGLRVNGGFFIFRKEIFDYINEGEARRALCVRQAAVVRVEGRGRGDSQIVDTSSLLLSPSAERSEPLRVLFL